MARLPQPGADAGTWGQILNDYLNKVHDANGDLKAGVVDTAQLSTNVQNSLASSSSAVQTINGKTGQSITISSTDVGLGNVNNTSDANKPVSTAVAAALNAKASTASLSSVAFSGDFNDLANKPTSTGGSVTTVAGKTGDVTLNRSDVGLANVDNTSDANKPISYAMQTALNSKASTSSLAPVATSGSYLDLTDKPSAGSSPVSSVAGKTGAVTLTKTDVGLANVDNTSDANKPISSAVQSALNAKASSASLSTVATSGSYTDLTDKPTINSSAVTSVASRTGDVTLTKADVGLSNVDNTSDANKPISTAVQSAIGAKYTKPGSGIPVGDLATNIQAQLTMTSNYVRASKSSDTAIASSATNAADPDLSVAVGANGQYAFELLLAYDADVGAGIRLAFTAPSGCTMFGIGYGIASNNTSTSVPGAAMTIQYASTTNSTFGVAGGVGSGIPVGYRISGTLTTGSNAGSLGLSWSQGISSSVATTLYKGSELSATKVG